MGENHNGMGDGAHSKSEEGTTKEVLELVKTTSSSYVASLEDRYRAISQEIKDKLYEQAEQKKVSDSLKKVLNELASKKKQQLEDQADERKKREERMAVLENEILNMQIYTSNLNEHNDLMKWFIQMWKTKFEEVKQRLSK